MSSQNVGKTDYFLFHFIINSLSYYNYLSTAYLTKKMISTLRMTLGSGIFLYVFAGFTSKKTKRWYG